MSLTDKLLYKLSSCNIWVYVSIHSKSGVIIIVYIDLQLIVLILYRHLLHVLLRGDSPTLASPKHKYVGLTWPYVEK